MKLITPIVLSLSMALLTACGGGASSAQSELMDVQAEMTTVFESVTDAESAKAAASKLEPLAERFAKVSTDAMAEAKDGKTTEVDPEDVKAAAAFSEAMSKALQVEGAAAVLSPVIAKMAPTTK